MSLYDYRIKQQKKMAQHYQDSVLYLKKHRSLVNQLEWEMADLVYSIELYVEPDRLQLTFNVKKMSELEVLNQLFSLVDSIMLRAGFTKAKLHRSTYFNEALSYRRSYSLHDEEGFQIRILNFDSPDCEVIEIEETVTRKKLTCRDD